MARTIASTLALLLTSLAGAPVTCIGWEGTAAARHACCARAHHAHASDQTAADDCCAHHEQGRQSEQAIRVNRDATIAVVCAVPISRDSVTAILGASAASFNTPQPHPLGFISPPLRI